MNFDISIEEMEIAVSIAQRASRMANLNEVDYTTSIALMDIVACHMNGNPLDLEGLLNAPDGDFGHDVFGIRRYINRETGVLEDFFVPRCSLPEVSHA